MKAKLTNAKTKAYEPRDKIYDIHDTEIAGFVLRVRPTGSKTYFLFYRNRDGKKRTYTIGSGITATQARDIAQRVYGDIKNGVDPNERDLNRRKEAKRLAKSTFSAFLEEVYKDWLEDNRKSGVHAYRRLKNSFGCLASKQIDQISNWDMERWRKARKQEGVSDSTIKNDVAEVKAMLNRARQWDFIGGHQLMDYKLPRTASTKIDRYLTQEEHNSLIEALKTRELQRQADRQSANEFRAKRGYELYPMFTGFTDHLMPMILLALNTGMRRGEIFKLKWIDVNFTTMSIRIRSEVAKSKRVRYIPMNRSSECALAKWRETQLDLNGLVFPSKDNRPFDNIQKAWTTLLAHADIENFRFHDLRHNFASQLVMKGVDLYTVKELLGHSTITVTERYAHLAPKKLADAVNLLL